MPTPLTINDPVGPPIVRTPVVNVVRSGTGGKDYTVDTSGSRGAWVIVTTVGPAGSLIQLPNGMGLAPAKSVLLTTDEVAQLSPTAIGGSPGVTVEPVTGIVLVISDVAMSLASDQTEQAVLNADGASTGAVPIGNFGDVKFTSSDPTKATIDNSGLITAKAAGTTSITATWGGFTASGVTVTVGA